MHSSNELPAVSLPAPQRRSTPPLLITPAEAAVALRLARSTIYELMGTGQLPSVRIGRARRIPVKAIKDFLVGLGVEVGGDAA